MCLDLVNTQVYGSRPERRIDRLAAAADVEGWRRAGWVDCRPYRALGAEPALAIRRAVERYFRPLSRGEAPPEDAWVGLVRLYADHAEDLAAPGEQSSHTLPTFEAKVLHSAIELAFSDDRHRLGECGGCDWLFVDRTRNRSKRWCTSHLCGNRAKARRHYARRKSQ